MATKLTKTLFIGMGGTGVKSILRTKQCFMDAYGEIPPMIAFLAIDTDKAIRNIVLPTRSGKDVSLDDNEICFCGITGSALDIYNHAPSKYTWLPKRNVNNLAGLRGEGAGAVRSNGRFLIRYNADPLSKAVAGKVSQIARPLPYNCPFEYDKNTIGMEYPTIVNIVGSVAGGTGSGTLIDMIVLAAETLKSQGLAFRIQPWIVLPEVFRTMVPGPPSANVYQNAYGAMRELDYLYHLPKSNSNPLDFGFAQIKYLAEEVDDAFLINNTNKAGIVLQKIDDVTDSIGRCMFLPSNEINSVNDNVKQVRHVYNIVNKAAHYKSSGSAELIYDNQAVGNVLARAIIADICDELCNTNRVGAEKDAMDWMTQVRIQEHEADLLTDDLLAKDAPYSVSIGKDSDVSHIEANIYSAVKAPNILDEVKSAYSKKLQDVEVRLKEKVDYELNQQNGVGGAEAFVEALIDGITLSLGEMKDEEEILKAKLAYNVDWHSKIKELHGGFFKFWSQDDADILANEVNLHIADQRDLLRHTYAIQFYNELMTTITDYQNKITLLKTNITAVSRKQVREIAAIQRSAVASKFQIYLHMDDVNSFNRPQVAATSAQLRAATPINTLLDRSQDDIEAKMWAYAKEQDDVKAAVNVTIEQKLSSLSEQQLRNYFAKMKELSSPLWSTNTRGYLDHSQPLTSIFTIGCYDAQNGIIQSRFEQEFTIDSNKPTFATTRQTDRITFFQTECYSPVYAVNNMPGYQQDAERKLNIDKHYPVCYLDEKWFQRMEVEKFDIFPQAETDTVLPNWVTAIVYGYVKFDEGRNVYYMESDQGDILDGGFLELGNRRDVAFDTFQNRGLDKEIEQHIQQEITRKGRLAVEERLREVKNNLKLYVRDYACLSPIELEAIVRKDQAYSMVREQLEKEVDYIKNLNLA